MDIHTKLATIRFLAAHKRPYFASALFAMQLVAEPRTSTMSVDRWGRVYVNPARIGSSGKANGKEWTIEQCAAVLIHELGHWLRKHHDRALPLLRTVDLDCIEQEAGLINDCEDCELNDDLESEGLPLPGLYLTPKLFKWPVGRTFEEYYGMIQRVGGWKGGGGGRGPGREEKPDCGSGAHGQPREWELPPPDGSRGGIGEAEADLLRRQVAREIQEAASRSPGSVPAGWKRWAATLLEPPVVPWERELSALVKNAVTMARGAVDYSYSRPCRRGNFAGVIMPAMVRPEPSAAVVLDTSGSMDGPLLGAALREIQGILRAVGQRQVPVLCCDADVHNGVQRVSSATQIELAGGGETDMGVGIAAATKLRANVIIVLTDGYTPWPDEPPRGCQLVVGILDPVKDWEQSYPAPDYAKRVLAIRNPKKQAA